MDFLTNYSKRGAFGEYAYRHFAQSRGFKVERTNFCHTDFCITNHDKEIASYVDVKTTTRNIKKYSGTRFHSEILYELICISKNLVLFFPDTRSPFYTGEAMEIGSLVLMVNLWTDKSLDELVNHSRNLDPIKEKVCNGFVGSKYPRVRVVIRGEASQNRWSGTVDNLPGPSDALIKFDATVFVEFDCKDFSEYVKRIMLFPHYLIKDGSIKMKGPNKRQVNKGIHRVIDLEDFGKNFPRLCFQSIDELLNSI